MHRLKLAAKTSAELLTNNKYRKHKAAQKCKGSFVATTRPMDNGVEISMGIASIKMRVVDSNWTPPPVYDYAIFGLAALSLSNGWQITADMPVSKSMAKKIEEIANAFRLWSIDKLAPLRIDLPSVGVENNNNRKFGRIMCLSGGVDSTFAAISARKKDTLDGCLLIAGADYPDANHRGFIELRERVSAIASALGSTITIVETNIRQSKFQWGQMHGFNLSSCLHFLSGLYESGGIGLDNTLVQDVVRNPWGNNAALPYLFSTEGFSIKGFGDLDNRVAKIQKIYEFNPSIINLLSVCWENTSTGQNCGHCRKCTEMRLALFALDIPDKNVFVSHPNLVDAIGRFEVSNRLSPIKGQLVRTSEIVDVLPKGKVRSRLSEFEQAVRHRYFLLDPFR